MCTCIPYEYLNFSPKFRLPAISSFSRLQDLVCVWEFQILVAFASSFKEGDPTPIRKLITRKIRIRIFSLQSRERLIGFIFILEPSFVGRLWRLNFSFSYKRIEKHDKNFKTCLNTITFIFISIFF